MSNFLQKALTGALSLGLSAGSLFAQEMHQVVAPDGSAAVQVPLDWSCPSGQRGMIDIKGPNGEGGFGLWCSFTTPEAAHALCDPYGLPINELITAPYCTPEQCITFLAPRAAARQGSQVKGIQITAKKDLGWTGMDAKLLGFTCMKDGVPMSYIAVIATWPVDQASWGFYESYVGVRSQDMQASWPWITQTFASFQVSAGENARRWKQVQDDMNAITQDVQDVTANRARAQDKAAEGWDDYIRGVWTYKNGDTGETSKMTPDEAAKKNAEAGHKRYKLPGE